MEPFDTKKTSNPLENIPLLLKNQIAFFLQGDSVHAAEFSPCRSPPLENSENMTKGRGVLLAHLETHYFRAWK